MHRAAVALVLCFAASAPTAQDAAQDAARKAEVKVIPDRTVVGLKETFKVRFTTDAAGAAEPDWSPLNKNFKVLSKNKSPQKTTVHEWNVHLQPKRAGKLKIPPLQFGAARSPATQIQVKKPPQTKDKAKDKDKGKAKDKSKDKDKSKAKAKDKSKAKAKPAGDFFVEVSMKPENPYVQAQVLFTLRVFMRYNLRGNVTPPKTSSEMIVENLGDARNSRANRGGKNYDVYERQYLVYPQKSGNVKIKPIVVNGSYIKQGRRTSVKKQSRALTLKVRQVPASFPGKFWLPAEGFKIKEDWSGKLSPWHAGEPLTRTLNLEARGLLARQVPEVDLSGGDGFRFYTEPADFKKARSGKTIIGKRQQSVVLIPVQAGVYTLPPVKVPWWNTRTDQLEFAELPAKEVTVSEAAFSTLTVDEPPSAGAGDAESAPAAFEVAVRVNDLWFWISVALLLGWLATVALMWRGEGLYRLFRAARQRRNTLRDRRRAIRQACEDNDAAAARDALMQWARMMQPGRAPTSLGQVGTYCGGVVEQQIQGLERALYARDDTWQGNLLWDAFASQDITDSSKQQTRTEELEPLHKLQ